METYPKFPTALMNVPATRLFSDVSFSDVLFSISFKRRLPLLASRNKLPKVEIFLQIKSFPSEECQTQPLNIKTVIAPMVREAISKKVLKIRPWVKDLRGKKGALGNFKGAPFVLHHSQAPAFGHRAAKTH